MKRKIFMLSAVLLTSIWSKAQCPLTVNEFGSAVAPNLGWWVNISDNGDQFGCNYAGEFTTMVGATENYNYALASDVGITPPTYVTVYDPDDILVPGAFGNVHNNGIVNFTTSSAGNYKVQINTGTSCGTDSNCRHIFAIGSAPYCTVLSQPRDGTFSRPSNSFWVETVITNGTIYPIVSSDIPLTGSQSAWLGGYGQVSDTYLQQSAVIPSGSSATLYFWLLSGVCDSASDIFSVEIDGNTVFSQNGGSAECGDNSWHLKSVDLTPYANGATHIIRFRAKEFAVNGGHSNFFVDDVTLLKCTPPDCPALSLNIGDACDDGNANTTNDVVNANCICQGTFSGSCPNEYILSNTETTNADYETNGNIITVSTVSNGAVVDYDAGSYIVMLSGFWAYEGSTVQAFIDGCNGTGGVLMPKPENNELPAVAKSLNLPANTIVSGMDHLQGTRPAKFAHTARKGATAMASVNNTVAKNDVRKMAQLAQLTASPNPAQDFTNISFSVPVSDMVTIELYDIQGRLVKSIFNAQINADTQVNIPLNTNDLQAGIYMVRLKNSSFQKNIRLVVN
ncbi:MAG: T9SS type A sorting domain-containing protein [Sphingobacteriales bacterium]|nr:T9SS type A sorting domain-containing protein [Sphingobacteriales bacterium]